MRSLKTYNSPRGKTVYGAERTHVKGIRDLAQWEQGPHYVMMVLSATRCSPECRRFHGSTCAIPSQGSASLPASINLREHVTPAVF